MNANTRRTRACSIDALDDHLKTALRRCVAERGGEVLEAEILMCCETLTVHPKKGRQGGLQTTLSAVYVTPGWLVWADCYGPEDVAAGMAPLHQIEVLDRATSARYALAPENGLSLLVHDPDQAGATTFIVLAPGAAGLRFRQILQGALRIARREVAYR